MVEPDCVAYDVRGLPYRVPCPPLGHTNYHGVGADEPAPVPAPSSGLSGLVDTVKPALVLGAAFHGYRRNKSIGWAIGWAILAKIAPVITTGVAVAQGYGKAK